MDLSFSIIKDELTKLGYTKNKQLFKGYKQGEVSKLISTHLQEPHSFSVLEDLYTMCSGYMPNGKLTDEEMFVIPPCSVVSLKYMEFLFGQEDRDYIYKRMIPFLTYKYDSFLCVNLFELLEFGYGARVYLYGAEYSAELPDYSPMYDSISSLLKTAKTCFDKKVFFLDEEGNVNYDEGKWEVIAGKENKHSLYWTNYKHFRI